jgi:hypothetical protein
LLLLQAEAQRSAVRKAASASAPATSQARRHAATAPGH